MNEYSCSICTLRANSFEILLKHVIRYHKYESNFKIKCLLRGCGATFTKWNSFKKNVWRNHPRYTTTLNELNNNEQQDEDDENEEDEAENTGIQIRTQLLDMQLRVAQFLVNIRETYCTSVTALNEITSGLEEFLEYFSGVLLSEIRENVDLNSGVISLESINGIFEQLKPAEVLSAVKSKHLLDKFLEKNFNMVSPQKIKVGISHRWIRKKTSPFLNLVPVEDSAIIVPFLANLTNLLKNYQIRFNIENQRNEESELLTTVLDGSYYKNNEFFRNNKNSLAIILYIDEVGITNPLGANSKKQKLYMIYWTLGNLHPKLRSSQDAIQLLGIVKSNIVKRHGLAKVFESFLKELKILQNQGISIICNNEEKNFKGSVLFVAGDTPASAEMGGFKMFVSAYRPCRTCFTDNKDWKTNFNEKMFTLRDKESHKNHVDAVTEPNLSKKLINFWKTKYGVNGPSPLDGIEHFDVTKCFPQDAMHVLILGVSDIAVRALLSHLIFDLQLFSLEDLNARIENFDFNHFKVNKPGFIFYESFRDNKPLKQSASQMFGLVHCLPFLIAEWVYFDDREEVKSRILCHSRLLQILNVCLSYEIHTETVDLLTRMIEIYLTQFNNLYVNTIVPKFHFLLHIPFYIKLYGPARQQWCFRFEATHNPSKSLVPVVQNFKNMPYTLAYRFQARLCSRHASISGPDSKNFLYQGHEISVGETVLIENLPNAHLLDNYISNVTILGTPKIKIHGTTYKPRDIILLENSDELLPVFGIIIEMFVVNENIIIVYNMLETLNYCEEFNAYHLKTSENVTQFLISTKNIIFPHPLPVLKFQLNLYVILLDNERTEFYS